MEQQGHLEGMLDRDQRTAKLRFFGDSGTEAVQKGFSFQEKAPAAPAAKRCRSVARTIRSSSTGSLQQLSCKNGHLLNTFQSVKKFLIVVVCLTLVTLPCAMSAPIPNSKMEARENARMKWINPCDVTLDSEEPVPKSTIFTTSELNAIINTIDIALVEAKSFSYKFAEQTFDGRTVEQVHEMYKNQKFDWLQMLFPKSFGEKVPEEHINTVTIEDVLVNTYSTLERLGVGLELVTWGQEDNAGIFAENFLKCENLVKTVLCEIRSVINAHGLVNWKEVQPTTREVVPDTFKNLDKTGRLSMDWIIFRDFMTTLEYIKEVLVEHRKKLNS